MLGNNRAQLLLMCERYVKAYSVTPHDDLVRKCCNAAVGHSPPPLLRLVLFAYSCRTLVALQRGELFLKSSTKLWSQAIIDVILPPEEEGGGIDNRWGAGPVKK
eukprot:SAG22_NODE_1707_length_3769_cov_3.054768_1_plen_104_part_00